MPVRYVSQGDCAATGYGSGDVITRLVAQQERMVAQMQSLSEDVASIRWQQYRPVQRAAPLVAPDKMMPSPQIAPQASPQFPPYEAPPPPAARKMPPLPQAAPQAAPPPQADAALQWQRALQAHRVRLQGDGNLPRVGAATGPDRAPYSLD